MKQYKQTLVIKFESYISKEDYEASLELLESESAEKEVEEWATELTDVVGADSGEILELTFDMEEV